MTTHYKEIYLHGQKINKWETFCHQRSKTFNIGSTIFISIRPNTCLFKNKKIRLWTYSLTTQCFIYVQIEINILHRFNVNVSPTQENVKLVFIYFQS